MMKFPSTRQRLIDQGFCDCDLDSMPQLSRLARWTPCACAAFGVAGIALALFFNIGGIYFLVLGLLTLTGGFTGNSIFDRLYNLLLRPIFNDPPIPPHGMPRRFGCAIGGGMYMASGVAFLFGFTALACGLAAFMILFALIAGVTQWCFASTLYKLLNH